MIEIDTPNKEKQDELPSNTPAFDSYARFVDQSSHVLSVVKTGWEQSTETVPNDVVYEDWPGEEGEHARRATDAFFHVALWMIVMYVTATEAYLQDALAFCAGIDPTIMGDTGQKVGYGDVVAFASIEALAEEVRSRWARNVVDDGGPTRWIKRLERMGARGYANDAADKMELMWGIRHLVVHRGSLISFDFVKRHGTSHGKPGENLSQKFNPFGFAAPKISGGFVQPTEKFLCKRFLSGS